MIVRSPSSIVIRVAGRLIRKLANDAPEVFLKLSVERLSSDVRSKAHRFLTLLVLRQESLLKNLTDPEFMTKEQAIGLFRRFLEVDPQSDVRLAQMLPARGGDSTETLSAAEAARALDILDATSGGRRLLNLLGHLPENGDTLVSSKATLFVGKRVQSPEWTATQLARSDQRIRANPSKAFGVDVPGENPDFS